MSSSGSGSSATATAPAHAECNKSCCALDIDVSIVSADDDLRSLLHSVDRAIEDFQNLGDVSVAGDNDTVSTSTLDTTCSSVYVQYDDDSDGSSLDATLGEDEDEEAEEAEDVVSSQVLSPLATRVDRLVLDRQMMDTSKENRSGSMLVNVSSSQPTAISDDAGECQEEELSAVLTFKEATPTPTSTPCKTRNELDGASSDSLQLLATPKSWSAADSPGKYCPHPMDMAVQQKASSHSRGTNLVEEFCPSALSSDTIHDEVEARPTLRSLIQQCKTSPSPSCSLSRSGCEEEEEERENKVEEECPSVEEVQTREGCDAGEIPARSEGARSTLRDMLERYQTSPSSPSLPSLEENDENNSRQGCNLTEISSIQSPERQQHQTHGTLPCTDYNLLTKAIEDKLDVENKLEEKECRLLSGVERMNDICAADMKREVANRLRLFQKNLNRVYAQARSIQLLALVKERLEGEGEGEGEKEEAAAEMKAFSKSKSEVAPARKRKLAEDILGHVRNIEASLVVVKDKLVRPECPLL